MIKKGPWKILEHGIKRTDLTGKYRDRQYAINRKTRALDNGTTSDKVVAKL
jgi:hypothetical protein